MIAAQCAPAGHALVRKLLLNLREIRRRIGGRLERARIQARAHSASSSTSGASGRVSPAARARRRHSRTLRLAVESRPDITWNLGSTCRGTCKADHQRAQAAGARIRERAVNGSDDTFSREEWKSARDDERP